MPELKTIERAKKDKREGKAPSTQAGEFVREEMDHIREGKHGARSAKQAIAIGLSNVRAPNYEISANERFKRVPDCDAQGGEELPLEARVGDVVRRIRDQ